MPGAVPPSRPFARSTKQVRRTAIRLAAAAAALGLAPAALADTWDNSTGSGLWSTANNWADNTEPTSTDPVILPDPIPGSTAITLAGSEQAQSLTFNKEGYNLFGNLGNTLTLANGGVACNNAGVSHINVQLNGTSGLNKTGNGELSFENTAVNNLFTGTVAVGGGTLSFIDNAKLGNGSNPITLNQGTLRNLTSVSMTRNITLGIFSKTIQQDAQWTMNGAFTAASGSNPVNILGTASFILTVASTRTGQTTIKNGTVKLNNGAGLGTGASLISDGGKLELGGAVTHNVFMFLGTNGTFRTAGTGAIYNNQCFVNGSPVTLNSGDNTSHSLQFGGGVANSYSGGSGATTIVNGLGTISMIASNNYQGDWQIDQGTLRIANGSGLGTGTTTVVVNNTGTLQLANVTLDRPINLNIGSTLAFEGGGQSLGVHTIPPSVSSVTLALKGTGNATLGDAANELTGGNASFITVTSAAAGNTLFLNQPNNYLGGWTIGSLATVRITDAGALGTGTTAVALTNTPGPTGGTLELAGVTIGRNVTMNSTSTLRGTGTATMNGTVTVSGTGTTTLATASGPDVFTIGNAANDYTGGSGGAGTTTTVSGPGTIVLPFANNYLGGWQLNGGTVRIGNGAALGTDAASSVVINSGAKLELTNVTFDRNATMNNGSTLAATGSAALMTGTIGIPSGAGITLATGASSTDVFTFGNAANDLNGGGATSAITVSGAGKIVLTQDSNYSGKWIVGSGSTLEVTANNQMGVMGTGVTLSGGILSTTTTFSATRVFTATGGTFLTAPATTLTLSTALGSGAGALTKAGSGMLVLTTNSSRSGTTAINAGTVRLTGSGNGLGTGLMTVNTGATLELANATPGDGGMVLNDGATLKATGVSSYSQGGSPQISNGPAQVVINVEGAADRLSIGSAFRNVSAGVSSGTLQVTGAGRLVLNSGGTSASDIFSGIWQQFGGVIQIGSSSGSAINALGFKNGDAKQANTIAVNAGTLAIGCLGSGANTPAFLRASVVLAGGNIASTNGIDGQFGGDFLVSSAVSSVLLFDPASTSTVRNVNLVAGAVGSDNHAALTLWGAQSTLVVDPGTTSGGAFNIARTGGTIIVIDTDAILQINQGATVNLGGTADALSDGTNHVNVLNNSTTSFNVTAGTKNIGTLDGVGRTTVSGGGATLIADHVRQSALTVNGTVMIRPNAGPAGTSRIDTLTLPIAGKLNLQDNKLITQSAVGTTIGGGLYDGITGAIQSGRNGGNWSGNGIVTSQTDATGGTNYTTIGVATAQQARGLTNATDTVVWSGQTVTGSDTLVMYTYGGDANLDGKVTISDYGKIDFAIAIPGAFGWFNGDFNYDGKVSISDYGIIDFTIGIQGAAFSTIGETLIGVARVPEPTSLALVATYGFSALAYRRRRSATAKVYPAM